MNQNLLIRLNELVGKASEPEDILQLTEAVAKLNASYRNNGQFSEPESDEARADREAREALANAMNGGQ